MIVEGQSQREVGRALHLSPHTVAKIIRTDDFQNFLREQRERLFGIAPIALDSLVNGVASDPYLAYALLKDLGIVPCREAMLALAHVQPPEASPDERHERQVRFIAEVMLERKRVFNIELPDEIQKALDKADE